jgi:hypothetical protein
MRRARRLLTAAGSSAGDRPEPLLGGGYIRPWFPRHEEVVLEEVTAGVSVGGQRRQKAVAGHPGSLVVVGVRRGGQQGAPDDDHAVVLVVADGDAVADPETEGIHRRRGESDLVGMGGRRPGQHLQLDVAVHRGHAERRRGCAVDEQGSGPRGSQGRADGGIAGHLGDLVVGEHARLGQHLVPDDAGASRVGDGVRKAASERQAADDAEDAGDGADERRPDRHGPVAAARLGRQTRAHHEGGGQADGGRPTRRP